jgi:hypothetical protein
MAISLSDTAVPFITTLIPLLQQLVALPVKMAVPVFNLMSAHVLQDGGELSVKVVRF